MYSALCYAWGVWSGVIGAITLSWLVYKIVDFILFHFTTSRDPLAAYRPESSSNFDTRQQRPFALISGSSGGIGLGLAESLVTRGFGVILLSNDVVGLANAKNKLKSRHPDAESFIETVEMDAITATEDEIRKRIIHPYGDSKAYRITILVNNVGGTPMERPHFRLIPEFSAEDIDRHINLNARFMAQLTRLMLPVLTSKHDLPPGSRLGRSLIINLSSGGRLGLPWLSMYCATKGFNASFSASISRELKATGQNVDCICIVPGDVISDSNNIGMGKWSPTAKEFGHMILDRIDAAVARGRIMMSPYWLHALQIVVTDTLPEFILQQAVSDGVLFKKKAYEDHQRKSA